MVRNLVGSLLKIGTRACDAQWLDEVLASRDRNRAAPTFAADGLYLAAVEYDPSWNLPLAARLPADVFLSAGLSSTVFS
jgi:tRNA pseudouridine38-40 synthase